MRAGSRLTTFVVFLVLTGSAILPAQEPGGSVPEEFMRAMVGADAGLLIGALPEDLAGLLSLPAGARVIGTVVYDDRSTAYVSVAEDPDAAITSFREHMAGAEGWRTLEERQPPRGFQRPEMGLVSATFCGPASELLSMSAGEHGSATIAQMQYYALFPGQLPCDRPSRPMRGNELDPRMPIINVPEDEYRRGTGTSSGLDSSSTGLELSSERTATQIADGIAEQITADGWTPGSSAGGDEAALRTWSRTFNDDFEARGTLTVVLLGPGTYEAIFRLNKLSER